MEEERRRWLERLADAARGTREDLVQLEGARRLRRLIADLEELEERLREELRAARDTA